MRVIPPCSRLRAATTRLIFCGLLIVGLTSTTSAQQSGITTAQPPTSAGIQSSPARQRNSSDRKRSLTGRVVEEGGQPIAEASVLATPVGAMGNSSTLAALRVRSGTTDESGRFVLDDLGSGAYTVTSFVPGFVPGLAPPGPPAYYRPGDSVTIQMVKGGVVTGTVTSSGGEPIAGIRVRATLTRDANGEPARIKSLSPLEFLQDWKTDDRGVYRIFGLEPGSYLVSTGGRGVLSLSMIVMEGYDNDASTYYPSATRDTALEVKVRAGEEVSSIDIRFREGRGHAISGAVSGKVATTTKAALVVTLTHASTGGVCAVSFAEFTESDRTFLLDSVPDGEYDLMAMVGYQSDEMMQSRPRRVVVKGMDVTGLDLALGSFGSISGRLVLEKALEADPKACPPRSPTLIGETVIVAKPDGRGKEPSPPGLSFSIFSPAMDGMPDDKGEFRIRPLDVGRYRFLADLPGENSFVRAIKLPPSTAAGKPIDGARNGVDLKPGERLTGMTITVAEGAAGIAGRVVPVKAGESVPSDLRVQMVPAEKETDDEVLRFFETPIDKDGAFAFKHVAPGRYFLMATAEPSGEKRPANAQPEAWRGTTRRAKLRRDAEAFNVPVQLSQCQRVTDQVLRYSPPQSTAAPRQ